MEKVIDLNKTPKKKLIDLLKELRGTEDRYILTANGIPLAVVMSQDEYEKYLVQGQAEVQAGMEEFLAKVRPRMDHNLSEEELAKEINDVIHEMRGIK